MTPSIWPCPLPAGGLASELAATFDRNRPDRLLIVPGLFAEGLRSRRLVIETMNRLDGAGIDSFLPDLPGTNESQQRLEELEPHDWIDAMGAAAVHFRATATLGIRGGCLFTPADIPAFHILPVTGSAILRGLIRERSRSIPPATFKATREKLMHAGLKNGLELDGYRLSAEFFSQLRQLVPLGNRLVQRITPDGTGHAAGWLQSSPAATRKRADTLAAHIVMAVRS